LVTRRISLGVLMLERLGRDGEARALALAVTALAGAVPFVLDARRSLMATDILDQVTPALKTSTHLRERTGGLATTVERCRRSAFEVFSKAPIPTGELNDAWRRLLVDAPHLPRADFLQRLLDLYWSCLSRLVRLVNDADASLPVTM
jgi:hypothetical protein